MERIALLLNPSSNRVYGGQTAGLALAELSLAARAALTEPIDSPQTEHIGGLAYLTFNVERLTTRDVRALSNLSATFAIFRREGAALVPVDRELLTTLPEDLGTIQRYQGKTNEQFTRLLVNAAAFVSDFSPMYTERHFRVLDPMCGRGTTLNQALLLGWDATGLEISAKDVEAYAAFVGRWLKDRRLKHKVSFGPVRRDGRIVSRHLTANFAATKELYVAGALQALDVWAADTLEIEQFIKPRSIDLLVGDAPYGVRHGSRAQGGRLERSPLSLIEAAAPGWWSSLRHGGGLALAWNTKVASREAVTRALEAAGFETTAPTETIHFLHTVDQSIDRDVLLARRP